MMFQLEYSTDLYQKNTIAMWLHYLMKMLRAIIQDSEAALGTIHVLDISI
ncbi:hypothetical protein I9X38_05655 [Bacillus mojavensis]|nr:hypothetical protein I9X38_05655 [Bacillus mojavensis]